MTTGIYHKYNMLLLRTLSIFIEYRPKRLFIRELAEELDRHPYTLRERIRKYTNSGYISPSAKKKLDPVTGRKAHTYSITRKGFQTYLELKHRYNLKFELNRYKKRPKRVNCYFGITKYGALEMGLTPDDIIPEEPADDQLTRESTST